MELVCLDILSLERSKGGFENILAITDPFTRYAQVFLTRNHEAKTTVKFFFDNFIVHYGFPARLKEILKSILLKKALQSG